jgi:MFS family permease
MIGSAYFIGVILSVAVIPRASDLYGRWWPVMGCCLLSLPLYFWCFWMTTLMEAYAIFFLMGCAFGGNISVSSLYVQELVQERHRAIVYSVGSAFECIAVAVLCIYFLYITKYWQGWYVCGVVIQVLIILGMLVIPESP